MDILEKIVAWKRVEVARFKAEVPLRDLMYAVEPLLGTPTTSMRAAISADPHGIIAEFKRRSPSRGWIMEHARAEDMTPAYEQAGAAALSILTDEHYFAGADTFVTAARTAGVKLPVLYKNFVIDEYQLLQARLCGADAVLLIAACLSQSECRTLLNTAHSLGLEVLLEMHDETETHYADLEPDMCGVNNRNLGTFVTDVNNSLRMAHRLPDHAVKVSESGIARPEVIGQLREVGYRGFLIGETFMKTGAPGEALRQFIARL